MSKVVQISAADLSNDDVSKFLKQAALTVRESKSTKVLVISVKDKNDAEDSFDLSFSHTGMNARELLAILTLAMNEVLGSMK